jgi:DNA-binding MarR family transcriptional regulator
MICAEHGDMAALDDATPSELEALRDAKRVLDAVRRIVRELREASRTAESVMGLSAAQLFVLHQLGEGGMASINALAQRTFTHQSSVSAVVTRLEQLNYVQRRTDPLDRRSVSVSLTAAGQEILAKAPEPVQERLVAVVTGMQPQIRVQLATLLEEFSLRLTGEEAPMFFEESPSEQGKLPG